MGEQVSDREVSRRAPQVVRAPRRGADVVGAAVIGAAIGLLLYAVWAFALRPSLLGGGPPNPSAAQAPAVAPTAPLTPASTAPPVAAPTLIALPAPEQPTLTAVAAVAAGTATPAPTRPTDRSEPTVQVAPGSPTAGRDPPPNTGSPAPADRVSVAAAPGSLQARIGEAMGQVIPAGSAAFIALTDPGPVRVEHRANQRRIAASAIKLGLIAEALNQMYAGELSFDEPYTVRQADVVGGTGSLQAQPGRIVTLRELAWLAIVQSDNVAANVLLARVRMEQEGFGQTVFERQFGDTAARAAGKENWTSATDLANMLRHLTTGTLFNAKVSQHLLGLLRERGAVDPNWLKLGLPKDTSLAHVNGTLNGVRNDAGIISFGGKQAYILVVCLDQAEDAAAERAIAELAQRVHQLVVE